MMDIPYLLNAEIRFKIHAHFDWLRSGNYQEKSATILLKYFLVVISSIFAIAKIHAVTEINDVVLPNL